MPRQYTKIEQLSDEIFRLRQKEKHIGKLGKSMD